MDATPPAGRRELPAGRRELEPLPYDGVLSVTVGTIVWLAALVVMLPFSDDLRADGHLWWIATAAVGSALGLVGIWSTSRRRNRLRRRTGAAGASRQAADPA